MDNTIIRMEMFIRENGRMIKKMDKDKCYMLAVVSILESIKIIKCMEKENFIGIMVINI